MVAGWQLQLQHGIGIAPKRKKSSVARAGPAHFRVSPFIADFFFWLGIIADFGAPKLFIKLSLINSPTRFGIPMIWASVFSPLTHHTIF